MSIQDIRLLMPNPNDFVDRLMAVETEVYSERFSCCQRVNSIAITVLKIIAFASVGALIGAAIGAVIAAFVPAALIIGIGASAGAGLGLATFLTLLGYFSCQHSKREALEQQAEAMEFVGVPEPSPSEAGYIENSVLVTQDSAETTEWRLKMIDTAKHNVEFVGNFCGGEYLRDFLDHVEQALIREPELKVHIVSHSIYMEGEDHAMVNRLKEAYPERFNFLVVGEYIEFSESLHPVQLHWKLMVVDDKFIIGGTGLHETLSKDGHERAKPVEEENCFDRFVFGGCRDMDVVGFGPSAEHFRKAFYKQYALWESLSSCCSNEMQNRYFPVDQSDAPRWPELENHERLVRQAPMKIVKGSSNDSENEIIREYVEMINGAQEGDEIMIGNLVFNPDPRVFNALQAAVARKVHLKVVTNGVHESSPFSNYLWSWSNRGNYLPLSVTHDVVHKHPDNLTPKEMYATEIYEYQVPNVLMHAKAMTVGDKSTIGSFNLGQRSLWDYELNVVFDSPQVAENIREVLRVNMDENHSRQVTLEEQSEYYNGCWANIVQYLQSEFLLVWSG